MTKSSRAILAIELEPIAGSRFQPTGFPDLGAATFKRGHRDEELLLVESVQSMANHLEAMTWDAARNQPAETVAALPYVRVVDADGHFLSSSRLEAHRLAASYVLDSRLDGTKMRSVLQEKFGLAKGRPLDIRRVIREVAALDPVSLVHGVFFAQSSWPWQPKIARALTAFIEATNVQPAVSGGVKRDSVVNTTKDAADGLTTREGYGMVPHHRIEYTAESINLHVVIDEQQLRSYGLSAQMTELLSALAAWEIATLLDNGLRLRTACDLVPKDASALPNVDDAHERLVTAIAAAKDELAAPTEVVWAPEAARKRGGTTTNEVD
jgi:CRISPR-associated protein Csb1